MPQSKKKYTIKKDILESRGWKQVSPGVYIANGISPVKSAKSSSLKYSREHWDKKFEEAKERYERTEDVS